MKLDTVEPIIAAARSIKALASGLVRRLMRADSVGWLVAEQEVITLSDRDRDAFLAALENPPEPTQALIKLMRLRP